MTPVTPPTEQPNHINPAVLQNQENMKDVNDVLLENMKNVNDLVLVNQEDAYHNESSNDIDEYFGSFPAGYKFRPDDQELIIHYLAKKVSNQPLPLNNFYDVYLYTKCPATLTAEYKCNGDNQWYFFTPRNRKYPRGDRPNRLAGNGYWKATGADKSIMFNKTKIGSKKALVFYEGKSPGGTKTHWMMYEYTLHNAPKRKRTGGSEDMTMDDWVLCKVYKNPRKILKSRDDAEKIHKIAEQPVVQPVTINEQKKQTPMMSVSPAYETSLWNPVLPDHQNHEPTLILLNQPELLPGLWSQEQIVMLPGQHNMLLNHMNQMDYSCGLYYDQGFHNYPQYPNLCGTGEEMAVRPIHYQSQQQPFVPIQNGFQDQQITSTHDMVMMLQSNVNSDNQQGDLRYDDQQTNVTHDNQQQGHLTHDGLQTNVTFDCHQCQVKYWNQQRQFRTDNQPVRDEDDIQEYIHPGSNWNFSSPPSHYDSNSIIFSFDDINNNNANQFFDIVQDNFSQQQSPSVPKKDENLQV